TAFWARAGTAATVTPPGSDGMISPPGPAYGDTVSGTNLAGGIAAALLRRERTGEAPVVDVSLLGSGLWALGHSIAVSVHLDRAWEGVTPSAHGSPTNPLSGLYRTADDRFLAFVMLQPARFWPNVCRCIGRPELADDPRFTTAEAIAEHAPDAVKILREVIASRTLTEWSKDLAALDGPWAPVQDTLQAAADQQVRANGYIARAGELELVASPVQFDVEDTRLGPAPEFAAQTEEILTELGYDWDRILALKASGAIT
ncbi:CoA transferase, partial [Streptomyces hayashii]